MGGGNVTILALGLATGIISARVLGPNLRGELVIAQTWAAMAAVVLTLGVTQAVVTYDGPDYRLKGPLLSQLVIGILAGGVIFGLLAACGEEWLTLVGIAGGAALTSGALATSLSAGYAQRAGKMIGSFQKVRLLPQACGVAAIVMLSLSGNRDPNAWLLASGFAMAVPCILLLINQLGGIRSARHVGTLKPPRGLVRAAGAAFIVAIGSQVIYRLDGLLVAVFLPTSQVAMYAVAVTAATSCAAVGQAVGMVTFSRLRGVTDLPTRRALVRQGTLRAAGLTAAVAIPVAIFAPYVIRFLYGTQFEAASGAMRVLVIAAIPLSVDYLLVHAYIAFSASMAVSRVQAIVAALTVGLLIGAIASGSIERVAIVSLVVYSISAGLLLLGAHRRTRIYGDPQLR